MYRTIEDSILTEIADEIRYTFGINNKLTIDMMVDILGSDDPLGLEHFIIKRTIETISDDKITSIGDSAFYGCSSLTTADFPSVTSIGDSAFYGCSKLEYIDFSGCTNVPALSNTNAFKQVSSTCQFKVPSVLLDEWKVATNWSTFASQIVGV